MVNATTLASCLAKVIGEPDRAGELRRDLRRLMEAGALKPNSDHADGRGTSKFSLSEACKARLLIALADSGIPIARIGATPGFVEAPDVVEATHERFVDVGRAMEPKADGVIHRDGGSIPVYRDALTEKYRLENLPDAIARGENWVLWLRVTYQPGRGKGFSGGFRDAAYRSNPDQLAHDHEWGVQLKQIADVDTLAIIELPASDLCKPLCEVWDWIA
ncbi:MAG: hypothetical protein ACXIVO_07815 [Glycocaulis sp.]